MFVMFAYFRSCSRHSALWYGVQYVEFHKMNDVVSVSSPRSKNWEDEEFDEVPLADLSDSELIEQRAEIYATIIQIQTQIADNEIFPRRDETWIIRAEAKIKHLRLESNVLGAELRYRGRLGEFEVAKWRETERTRRYELTERRRAVRTMYKDGLFVLTCKKLFSEEQMQEIWTLAQDDYPDQPCWSDPMFEELRDAICKEFLSGVRDYGVLAEKFFVNRTTVKKIVQNKFSQSP